MKFQLSQLLQKRGIEREEDLSPDEKAVFDRYKAVLNGETVTVDKIREFCDSQIKLIQAKFADSAPNGNDLYLKACLHVYLNILKAIDTPEMEREALERHLTSLIQ